jgi:hypothetical protein
MVIFRPGQDSGAEMTWVDAHAILPPDSLCAVFAALALFDELWMVFGVVSLGLLSSAWLSRYIPRGMLMEHSMHMEIERD